MRWATLMLALGLLLAGCSENPDTTTSSTGTKATQKAPGQAGGSTSDAPVSGDPSSGPSGDGNGTVGGSNQPPTASLKANATSGAVPLDVAFTLEGSDADGDALTAQLKVGDEAPVTITLPGSHRHTFDAAGNYTVVLTVSDGNATAKQELVISATAAAPALAGPLRCDRVPTEEAEGLYLFEGDGGTWVFLEDNDVPGLQVANTHPTSAAGADKDLGAYNVAWEGCEDGDLMIF